MLSTAIAAWRNLVKRLTVDWLILAAGAVTVLLAMVLLAAGPIYADAVTQSSLRRALADAPHSESTVVIDVRTPPDHFATVDDIATAALDNALAGVGATVIRVSDAEALELDRETEDDVVQLAQVRSMEAIAEHASLLEGSWPRAGLETAVSSVTADQLGLALGDTVSLTDRRDRSRQVELQLVGVFQPEDGTGRYWLQEELVLDGMTETPGFLTFGPFVVAPDALAAVTPRVIAEWRAFVDFDSLEVSDASRLRARVAGLSRTLDDALATVDDAGSRFSEFGVETELDGLLAGTARSLTVTRSSVLALLIQLAILAGYALALTAGLLVETRSTETYLLQARGVSPPQMVGVAALEGALLTVPIALFAPSVAAWTLERIAAVGPLSTIVLEVAPTVTGESRVIALIAAAFAVIGLAWPAWRSARSASGTTRRSGRQRSRSGAQRAGIDIALLGLAVLAFWQLQSLGPEVSATVQGRFGIDPVLIAAPTLGLLAGAVLALRIVPLLARLGERIAGSGRGSVAALSAWQVARRPVRYARSALLLIMAVAIGFFATSYSSTWLQSQRDQADFQVGADLRVAPNRRTGDSVSDLHLLAAQHSIPGVARSMPLSRVSGPVPGMDTLGEFVLLDSSSASQVVEVRSDLAPAFGSLMSELEAGRYTLPGIELAGEPEKIGVMLESVEEGILAIDVIPDFGGAEGELLPTEFGGEVSVVLRDDDDLLHRVGLGQLAVNEGPQTLEASLLGELDGARLRPAYPLHLVAIEIASAYPSFAEREVTLDLTQVVTSSSDGSDTIPLDPGTWNERVDTLGQAFAPARITSSEHPEGGLRVVIDTGLSFQALAVYSFRLPALTPSTYPVVVTSSWLEGSNRDVGDEVSFGTLRTGRTNAVVVGTIESFPSTQPRSREVVIADLPTYQAVRYSPGAPIAAIGEHWLQVDRDPDHVSEALRVQPLEARAVEGRAERFLTLSTDPVALGTIGALSIGFVAAAVFAAVGFAVSATVSARERITEFGLLRALGLSSRQLGTWMTLEQGVLVISSLGFGTLVGWALTTVILPLVTVTQQGTRPIPDLTVVYPWDAVVVLEVSLVVVLAVIVAVMSLLLRRLGLGSLLRVGEE
jgi:hypothetical protein